MVGFWFWGDFRFEDEFLVLYCFIVLLLINLRWFVIFVILCFFFFFDRILNGWLFIGINGLDLYYVCCVYSNI